ncbi:MAG: 5'-methylthioadenosine/S-adenosylhomocysteine nucleosidase [Candidatus Nealsonbacteria bacterium]|nr:5'-methylthioadenosine/S-adenosylhomocysteine nucleosidase [Candidatus Nealsonbacteria bacterium]
MARAPTQKTVKMLFAASGNACAFPGCATPLFDGASGVLLGELCHIEAASPGGPRYGPTQTEEHRNSRDNLIILCPNHHSVIDQDPQTYTAESLTRMKAAHESKVVSFAAPSTIAIPAHQSPDLARQVAVESVDFAIVVALPQELEALRRYFPELSKVQIGDGVVRTYYRAEISAPGRTVYRVVATLLNSMGNLEAAHATADLIHIWSPRFVLVNGIAGGLRPSDQEFGDVVVSDSIVYYELGKVRDSGVERRNRQFPADRRLLKGMLDFTSSRWRKRLPIRPDNLSACGSIPRIHIGPIASGEKVIAATQEVDRLLQTQPDLIAVEMESAGVASAAFSALKQVGFLTVRAICDFANASKDDRWHAYAASSAASCLREFLESGPIAPSDGQWPNGTPVPTKPVVAHDIRRRKLLFDRLRSAVNMDGFRDFCFLIGVDIDELPGDRKSARVRELILLFDRRGELDVLEALMIEFIEDEDQGVADPMVCRTNRV